MEAAAKAQSIQLQGTLNQQEGLVMSSSPSQNDNFLGGTSPSVLNSLGSTNNIEKLVNQKTGKILAKMKNDPLWSLDKEFKAQSWFKKNTQLLIDTIDNLLSDMSFSQTTVRVAVLLLANVNIISKGSGSIKSYLRNPATLGKIESLLESYQKSGEENQRFDFEQAREMQISLKSMFPQKDVERLLGYMEYETDSKGYEKVLSSETTQRNA